MGRIIFSIIGVTLGALAYLIIYVLLNEEIQRNPAFQSAVVSMSVAISFVFVLPAISHQSVEKSASIARMGASVFFPTISALIFGVAAYLATQEQEKFRMVAMICGGAVFWIGLLVIAIISMATKEKKI